jgi:O-antigen/teichoic acid export membrane protein
MTIRRRIVAGVGANAYGQIITIGIQLLALPVFLHYWDARRYGAWLMLSAVPSYFSLADVGMVTTTGNKMTMEIGRGNFYSANRTFQSALVFMVCACAAVFAVTVLVLAFVHLPAVANAEYRLTLGLLITAALLALFNGLAEAVFRATGRYGIGTMAGQSIRLLEWLGGMLGLYLSHGFVAVSLGMLMARGLGVCAMIGYAAISTRQIRWGVNAATYSEMRAMVRPAAMFMMFPIVNALSFQGFTLLVGGLFGAINVAVFNTYRTLARVTVQATSTLSNAAAPEMSRLYGGSNRESLAILFRRANLISGLLAVGLPLGIGLVGHRLIVIWTHSRIPYYPSLLWPMLVYAGLSSSWHVSRILLLSTNKHSRIAVISFLVAVIGLGMGWLAGEFISLDGVVWVLVVGEFVMVVSANRLATQVLRSKPLGPHELQNATV